MTDEIKWVSRAVALAVHAELISEHGGLRGVDEPALESTLARPIQRLAYGDAPSIFELAAEYAWGFARNHPFTDGNKRMGFVAMAIFLELNGYELHMPEVEATHLMVDLAAGRYADPDEIAPIIESASDPVR